MSTYHSHSSKDYKSDSHSSDYAAHLAHLNNLISSRQFFLTEWNKQYVRELDDAIWHEIYDLGKFTCQKSPERLAVYLRDLTTIAQKLGCRHGDREDRNYCQWNELHEMIGGMVEELGKAKR
ncbi:MAG: hypothetical protein Q9225_003006 [Loekoesia sp. 1 TL-2023]